MVVVAVVGVVVAVVVIVAVAVAFVVAVAYVFKHSRLELEGIPMSAP